MKVILKMILMILKNETKDTKNDTKDTKNDTNKDVLLNKKSHIEKRRINVELK